MAEENKSIDDFEDAKEAMIRWQQNALERRTSANSHFLTYAAAILALQTAIVINKDTVVIGWPITFIVGGAFAIVSLVLGSLVVLIRLRDARLTARIARYRLSKRTPGEIQDLRESTICLGKATNVIIPFQVVSFSLAAIFFCVWVVGSNWVKF
jgi:hypothetical protein